MSLITFDANASILFGQNQSNLIITETLADIFEATAKRLPLQTAIVFESRTLSYGELDTLSSYAASRLIGDGVQAGKIVGLLLPRGIELLVMQLAIAKTGAAWLPFDADTPVDRIAICLSDANAMGVISCDALVGGLNSLQQKNGLQKRY